MFDSWLSFADVVTLSKLRAVPTGWRSRPEGACTTVIADDMGAQIASKSVIKIITLKINAVGGSRCFQMGYEGR